MITKFSLFSASNPKDILIECAPNKETANVLRLLSVENINELFALENIHENIFGWIKDKVSDLGGAIKNIATKTLSSLASFVGSIKNSVLSLFSNAYDFYKNQISNSLDSVKDAVQTKVLDYLKSSSIPKPKIAKEISHASDVITFLVKYFTVGVGKDAEQVAKTVSTEDEITESIMECLFETMKENPELWRSVNEGSGGQIPFLSKIAHKLAEYPPFSYLHKIQHTLEHFGNHVLDALSKFVESLGGPAAMKFTTVGAIIGLVGEFIIKNLAVAAITDVGKFVTNIIGSTLLSAIPPIIITLKLIKYTALCLWVISFTELIIKNFKH
jgi:hypothetical protein